MLFNSIGFGIFFILVFAIWWLPAMQTVKRRNIFIILTGSFFYGCWDIRFLALLYFTATVDFLIAKSIENTSEEKKRKRLLLVSLLSNLSVLGFFKYFNFFADSFSDLLMAAGFHPDFATLNIVLPVGISFYTFQALSYTIDVYRKRTAAVREWHVFYSFITFFPQLVAGPIARAAQLVPQLRTINKFSYENGVAGLQLLLWGFFKKCVIADNLSSLVDAIFKTENPSAISVAVGGVAFAIQVYCDFSGYSLIAKGTARLLGIELADNFHFPYFATSLRDFWRRWHISLSSWLNDYVFTVFIVNRRDWGNAAIVMGMLLTFTLSGLWHGAAWTFVIWGLLHGIGMTIEFAYKHFKLPRIPAPFRWLLLLLFVSFTFLFFRATDLSHAIQYLANAFTGSWSFDTLKINLPVTFHSGKFALTLLALTASMFVAEYLMWKKKVVRFFTAPQFLRIAFYYMVIAAILFVGMYQQAPSFIYFQF